MLRLISQELESRPSNRNNDRDLLVNGTDYSIGKHRTAKLHVPDHRVNHT